MHDMQVQTLPPRTAGRFLHTAYGLLTLACMIFCCPFAAQAVDEENCLFCHQYRGLSYINRTGDFKLLYVTEDLYVNSPHGNLKCTDCHANITKFPHEDVQKVNCLVVCHMDEPSSGLPFSHQNVGDYLAGSVHGTTHPDSSPKDHPDDYPGCVTCHMDPLYRPLTFVRGEMPGLKEKTVQRCSICHEDEAFMSKFYNHFTSRMQKPRTPLEVIKLCGSCHGNTEMMERHGLPNLMKSYMETYHGKAIYFGDEQSADCNDCHVMPGESIHAIRSMHDPTSASYKDNIYKTCSDIDCHPDAEMNLAGYKAHVIVSPTMNPVEYTVIVFFVLLTLGSFIPLMIFSVLDMARNVFPNVSFFKRRRKPSKKA